MALEEAGIPVLENRAVKITRPNGDFWLAGLGDQRAFKRNGELYGTDDLDGTLAQITDDAPAIMMAHEPDAFVDMDAKIALTISGHTHGGQTTFFGKALGVPSKYGTKYAYGHIREDHGDLVVTSGLGCAVVPLRLGVVPEIAVIELS
jgi:predicted MPP superfamily phosphohydrolase